MRAGKRWVVALTLLAGCAGTAGFEGDRAAETACRQFTKVSGDAADDLMTDEETRVELREVHEVARTSKTPKIAERSADVLRAATQGDSSGLSDAVGAFLERCIEIAPDR